MPDRITEEMVGAYVDNELGSDERRAVERALLESEALQELHDELMRMRAAFGKLPRYELSGDFRERVARRIASVQPGLPKTADRSTSRTGLGWMNPVVIAGTLAVGLVVLAVVGTMSPGPEGGPSGLMVQEQSGEPTGRVDWTRESLVYYLPESERRPIYSLVIDVSLTPQGQADKAFEAVLKKAGIPLDPDLAVDDELESSIFASRMVSNVEGDAVGEAGGAVVPVQMTYVVGDSERIDSVWYQMLARPADFFPRPRFDLTTTEADRNVMYQLNDSSRQKFADRTPPTKSTLAHRLVFSVSLRSSLRLLGKIPSPALDVRLEPVEQDRRQPAVPQFELSESPRDDRIAPRVDSGERTPDAGDEAEISEVLFILRHLPD